MCSRYFSPEEAEIERFWHIGRHNNKPFARRANVSPTSIIPILRLDRSTGEIELVNARWGLIPTWWKEPKLPRTTHNAYTVFLDCFASLAMTRQRRLL